MGKDNVVGGVGGGRAEGADEAEVEERIISWEMFKKLFFDKYFPISIAYHMGTHFLELKQGDMTVAEYNAKFNELAHFALNQVSTNRRKARRFEQGLKPCLFNRLAVMEIDNYVKLVEKAMIAEGSKEAFLKFNWGNNKKNEMKKGPWNAGRPIGRRIEGSNHNNQLNRAQQSHNRKTPNEERTGGRSVQKRGG